MARYDFDLFTIGAGSGGVAASRRAAAYGARVGICEYSRVGGTCVIRGCVPKKLLVYAAHFAEDFEDAAGFGWTVDGARLDWGRLIDAKNREIDRLNQFYINLLANSGVELIEGRGHLLDAHTIQVGDRSFTAETILIATGGWPVVPDIPGAEHFITSNEALELDTLPRRVVVVGGGYIGCEFASIFNGAGAGVTQVMRADLPLRGFDADVRATLAAEMAAKDIRLIGGTVPVRLERHGEVLRLSLANGEVLDAEAVLAATGRDPNTRRLGLDEAGVLCNGMGAVLVDAWSRTNIPNIYAIGDCTDRLNLTPVAIAEGRALAETLFNGNPTQIDLSDVPTAVFSLPPVGTVGVTEAEARRRYGRIDVYRSRFRPMKHTLSGREERSMMKLVVDQASDRVVGCHMVGMDAPEIVQGFAVALKCGATKAQFDATIGIHPSAAEEFVQMREKVREPRAEAAE